MTSDDTLAIDDHRLAERLAGLAGQELLRRRELSTSDAEGLGAEGDRLAHELLLAELAAHRPNDAVLSEHGAAGTREPGARVWIVDPLDGTVEYGERALPDWAVHVALAVGDRLEAGAIALPAKGFTYGTAAPPTVPAPQGLPRIAVSRRRPPAFTGELAAALGAELVPMGSAGAKIAAVISGEVDAYVHAGGQYVWDSAAPVAVAWAAGLHASRLDGSDLRYDQPDLWLPDLVVCRPELAERLLAAVAAYGVR